MATTTATQAATAISSSRRLINELYDMLEREQDPNNTVILELILGQWEQIGDIQMALGVADEIIQIDPQHAIAHAFINKHRPGAYSPAATASSSSGPSSASTSASRTTSASSTTTPGIGSSIMGRLPMRTFLGSGGSNTRNQGINGSTTTTGSNTASENGSISVSARPNQLDPIAAMAAGALNAGKMRSTKRPLFFPAEPKTDDEKNMLEEDLVELFKDLQARAAELECEMVILENVGLVDNAEIFQDTRNIKEGRLSEVIIPALPRPVRQLVRELHGDRQECLDLVIQDFIEVAQWTLEQEAAQTNADIGTAAPVSSRYDDRADAASTAGSDKGRRLKPTVRGHSSSASFHSSGANNGSNNGSDSSSSTIPTPTPTAAKQFTIKRLPIDVVRERLRRRQELLDAMLPPGHGLEDLGRTAMMRVEHQLLDFGKKYANDKTMLLDDVSAIRPENLLVTSDNYAWDMAELADALAVNSAVMRNPLTRDMFSEEDVRQILNHPLGQRLRPMAVEQSQLKRGVRADTIDHMDKLSRVMLEDQSAHATPTIEAIDVFMAYYHTLPEEEKRTLKSLKVPATDSHTGQAYDSAILEAIQDAKANRVCYHKIGDFLKQAAKNLKDNN
ncbi:hypothetical protein F503_00770 [Ophiostoma piceae UAMH 11346]|uniref:Uncharacterized protein n=1 Tax=Ophiostoma piceae (strain UAMH 11346) TaxID=1262450 RepID=S3C5B5_OPHP1|nr:hypothetical protein F503_00770 [Ophiostoma piceae UAMH 11346]